MIKPVVNKLIIFLFVISGLSACGGGGGGSSNNPVPTPTTPPVTPPAPTSQDVTGGGVKGPLANAVVTVFVFDATQTGFKGATVATGATDNAAAITGLALPFPISPPYIMEFTSNAGTTDITTGLAPVISTLRTVITQTLLDKGEQIYATPLTTMAVDIAIANSTPATTAAQFEATLTAAASQVVSTVGFGMSGNIDIFDVPPLVDSTTLSAASQADVAAYRTAVEALTAVVFQMEQQSVGGNSDAVLSELSNDLADGVIDGTVSGAPSVIFTNTTLDVLAQNPASLPIPNSPTSQTVGDVQAILVSETATTHSTTTTTELAAGGSINTMPLPAEANPDSDGDGTLNALDAFPDDDTESVDTDGDGIGDNSDPDIDGDGILNEDEGTPPVPTPTDTDGDTIADVVDNCPANFNTSQTNTDGLADGGDACDADDDEDGALDTVDLFPLDVNEKTDADGDGIGDVADTDDDNDGLLDTLEDAAAADPDADGVPNREDTDSDGDGVFDSVDFAPYDSAVTFNNAPITNNSSVATDEDIAAAVTLLVTDDGVAVGPLVFNITGPTSGTLSGAAPNLTYTPNAEFSGNDSFTFTATDSDSKTSNTSTVSITVNAVNDAPAITQAGPLLANMDEDGVPTAFVAPVIDALDAEGDSLNWTGTVAANGTATVSGTGASPTITYVPNANFNGSDSFDVTVSDANGGSDTITVDVVIALQNDAPAIAQISPLSVVMDEDEIPQAFVTPVIAALDVDNATITLSWSGSAASNGTATVSGTGASPTITYVPNANFNGSDSFDVTVSDVNGGSDSITIVVTINSQNDVPLIAQSGPLAVGMDEDALPLAFSAPIITATDLDLDTLSWAGTAATNGTATVSGSGVSPTISYVPNANFNSVDSFDVTVSDGNGGSDSITIDVTVAAQNDLPTISGPPITVATDGIVYSFTPTAGDIDGEALTFSIQNQPSWATGFNVADGTLSGTPGPGDVGGSFINIIISVTAGVDTVDLPAFSITVNATVPSGAVWDSFNWDDGSTWQ